MNVQFHICTAKIFLKALYVLFTAVWTPSGIYRETMSSYSGWYKVVILLEA